jgi:hypothetical protein
VAGLAYTDDLYKQYLLFGDGDSHAALWKGSEFIDLNPTGYDGSIAYGVSNGYQVGLAYENDGFNTAALWSGSANSFVNLGALLPAGCVGSYANGIYVIGNQIWVAGGTGVGDYSVGALWHYTPVPEPSSLLAFAGGLLGIGGMVRRRRK